MLQRSAVSCGGWWLKAGGFLETWVSFLEDMDTGVQPPANLIKADVDDVQHDATAFSWVTDRCFKSTFPGIAPGPADIDVKTLTTHPLFRSALGALVFPFDKQTNEFVPTAVVDYIDPAITIDIEFQVPMDQTVTPPLGNLAVYANGVSKALIVAFWQDATHLRVAATGAGLGGQTFEVECTDETDLFRCLQQQVVPRFRITAV